MRRTIVIAVIALLLAGCSASPTGKVASQDNVKIGVMTITSGDLAFMGEDVVKVAKLAVEELGAEDKVDLVVEDISTGTRGQTISAYRNMAGPKGIETILSVTLSDDTLAVAPLLEKDKTVMITASTGGENIDKASPYLFRNAPSDILAGTRPAQDFNEKGIDRIALFTDNGAYTRDIRKHFVETYNGELVVDEFIDPQATDHRGSILKLKNKEYDAVMILSAAGKSGNYMMKQMHEQGIDKPVYLNFFAYNEDTQKVAGQAAEGAYVYDIQFNEEDKETKAFFKKYMEEYGELPTYKFHAIGTYDSIKMMVEAIEKVGYDGEEIREYLLENVENWEGLNRNVTFDERGNDMEWGFTLKRIEDGELVSEE